MKEIPVVDAGVQTPYGGVSPSLLLSQVKNATPFIFDSNFTPSSSVGFSYLVLLRKAASQESPSLTHDEYFELCLSAHHATVASYYPTEVGNQIQFQLWDLSLSKDIISNMAFAVTKSYAWESPFVSRRWITSPLSGERLSTHCGEWLRTAIGAYGALKKKCPNCATDLIGLMNREVKREIQVYEDIKSARDGIGLLKASVVLTQNLGDLNRVMDLWGFPDDDPLRQSLDPTQQTNSSLFQTLTEADYLYKNFMMLENPQHFALREPRCLRRSADLLFPIGPFLDEWGDQVAKHPELQPEEIGTIVEALVSGYEKFQGPIGYTRALSGILEEFQGGLETLCQYIPTPIAKSLRTGLLSSLCSTPEKEV